MVRRISDVCQSCDGDCCKALNIISRPGDKMRALLGLHYGREPESIERVQIRIYHRCPHLMEDGKCDLWHEDPAQDQRPPYCQEYLCDMALNPGVLIVEAQG